MSLSVLLSLYRNSNLAALRRCLASIWTQTVRPTEIVLVFDGPVSEEVGLYCEEKRKNLPMRLVKFEENRGLGPALRDGLEHCNGEYVARMDTDDVSVSDRFERQSEFLDSHPSISLVGGKMRESFGPSDAAISLERPVPLTSQDIAKAARYRNPMNHPTIMFRRNDVIEVGNYQAFPFLEDYHLVARMIGAGKELANIDHVLVETEPDDEFFRRRGGVRYLRQEMRLAAFFLKTGFHRPAHSIMFMIVRVPYRLVPLGIRRRMYMRMLRRKSLENRSTGVDVRSVP